VERSVVRSELPGQLLKHLPRLGLPESRQRCVAHSDELLELFNALHEHLLTRYGAIQQLTYPGQRVHGGFYLPDGDLKNDE
jgi:hypothetical protein